MNKAIQTINELIGGRQHHRILRLSFPHNNAPASELLVNRLEGYESVSRGFEFKVELLCDNRNLPLKDMLGKLLCVRLVRKDGTLRFFTGYCLSFSLKKVENIAFYEARLAPWFDYLALRKNNCLFHNKTLIQQINDIFRRYATHAAWDYRQRRDDAAMTYACQFDETDSNYVQRRLEAAGWHYFYEHSVTEHKLILSDDSTYAEPIEGDPNVRLHRHGGAQEEDAISEWSSVRHVTQSSVAVTAFDFKSPTPRLATMPTVMRQGKVPAIETYEYAGAYGIKNLADGDRLTRLRMEEIEKAGKQYHGRSNNFRLAPGRYFKLHNLPGGSPYGYSGERGKNEFLVLEVCHVATNNYLQSEKPPEYSNTVTCIRKAIPWRPGRNFNSVDTKILAPQSATVVGPEGQGALHVDQYGCIRVQFHWDREGRNNDCSSAWIRSATPWAGNQLGIQLTHRIDSEVLLVHIDGNPDRPFVLAGVHNANYMPPWSLPSQRALTGLRSRELTPTGGNGIMGRSNFLVLDDTSGKIQAQLKSDHEHSQLSLGYITRLDGNAGRRESRGQGWELYTQAWGVARAARGMLLTTESRPGATSHTKDMDETVRRLKQAQQSHQALAEAAEQAGAQEAQERQQAQVAQALDAQNKGIAGAGAEAAEGEDVFPELAAPHLVLASPAGIQTTTSQSTHIASDEHTAITTGKSLSIASGDSFFASIARTLRLFAHKAGMKLIAGAGDIDMQALSDSINLLAKLNITQTANRITITAQEEIVINGGGSYAKFNAGGIEHGTNGVYINHAADHQFLGPKNLAMAQALPKQAKLDGKGVFHFGTHAAAAGRANVKLPFKLYKNDALTEEGHIDGDGNVMFKHDLDVTAKYALEFPGGQRYAVDPGAHAEGHEVGSAVGYHGYENEAGSLGDFHTGTEQDRALANPLSRDGKAGAA
ncbi:MAG: type VI secretion system Vgr family protein [Pseudomonadota bacterium]